MQPGGSIVEIPPQSLVWSEPQEWRCSSSWDREELDEAHKKFLDELPAKAGFYIFTDSQLLTSRQGPLHRGDPEFEESRRAI